VSAAERRAEMSRARLDADAVRTAGLDAPALVSAPLAIYAVDLGGNVCLWNRAAEALFGWTAEDVLGDFPPFLHPDKLEQALDVFARVLRGQLIEHERFAFGRADGSHFHGLVSASLLRDDDGAPLAALTLVRDVTDETVAERSRRDAEGKWRRLALQAVDSVSFTDADGHVVSTWQRDNDALGYPVEWWSVRNGFEVLHPDDVERAADLWAELASKPGTRRRDVLRAHHADGHFEQVEFTGVNLLDDPAVGTIVVASRVVSSSMQSERLVTDEAQVLELVARDAPLEDIWRQIVTMVEYHTGGAAGVLLCDEHQARLRLHAAGSRRAELVALADRHAADGLACEDPAALRLPLVITDFTSHPCTRPWGVGIAADIAAAGFRGGWTQPIIETRSPELRGLVLVLVPDPRPPTAHEREVAEVAANLGAIALERAGRQEELRRQARSDTLTGLPNRTAIFEQLDATLAEARVLRAPVTTMVVDLDRFKVVNDSLGHDLGDELLVRVAGRVRAVMGEGQFVGRMAADEFVVVFAPGVRLRAAKLAAGRLATALEEPFTFDDEDIHLTASVGLAMSALGRESADAILQRADAAMFRAKAAGRDRIEVYDERLRTLAIKRLEIDRELRVALERGELQLYYQPQIDSVTRRIVGAEALLRWQHPTRGLIQPDGFVNIAEESGIIVPIGHWVLDEAVRQARTWSDAHPFLAPFTMSVNLSARQLINRSLVDTVAFVLTRYDWPPSNLTLELTESILIEDRDATLYVLNRLRMLGVKLAIDDFGTGFASLDYLHRLHVDWIKIDKSFVERLDAEGNGSPVATAMMHMARAFDLGVIAEGVEEQRQLDGLQALGCDLVQGFLFARPMPPDDLELLLREPPPEATPADHG
jgi:diguanylate cyclase (GGDEF)-like protein/PAS domain S-box-containing protein